MKRFYSYLWLNENRLPYYVGQGSGRRAFSRRTNRVVPIPKNKSLIAIFPMETKELAIESEKALIELFGRIDNGTGILRNVTDGGVGPLGHKCSAETIAKMSGKIPWNAGLKYKLPAGHSAAIAAATKRKWQDPEYKVKVGRKISATLTGKKLSPGQCRAISESHRGKPWTEARRKAQEMRHVPQT